MKKLVKKPFKFQEGGTSPNPLIFGTDDNPIELEGIDVTAKKLNWLEKRWNANGQPEFRRTDIWKFNPEDYEMKWGI